MEQTYSNKKLGTGTFIPHLCVVLSIGFFLSCDPVEREYSGTYREVTDGASTEALMALEFIRLGDNAMGLVRNYRSALSDEPFTKEVSCVWSTLADAPDEDGNFNLSATTSAVTEGFKIKGEFVSDTQIKATLEYDDGDVVQKTFERYREEPNKQCNTIKPYLISPQFKLGDLPQTMPEEANYQLKRPVFVTLWLGVRAIEQGGAFVYVGKQLAKPFFFLDTNTHRVNNGVKGDVSLSIPKPDEEMLIQSGNTKYALAHFVLIDDRCDTSANNPNQCTDSIPERFSWDVDKEPIIATSLEFGIEQSNEFPSDANGLGKAIFFVDGKLSELHNNVKSKIVNIDQYTDGFDNKHFYIVDIFFKDDAVVGMRLPKDPSVMGRISYREVQLKLTKDYLATNEILLPRLLTLENL